MMQLNEGDMGCKTISFNDTQNRKIIAYIVILLIISSLSILVYRGFQKIYVIGVMKSPFFWSGLIFWVVFGFFYHEIKFVVNKHNQNMRYVVMAVCFILYSLASTGRFSSLKYFLYSSLVTPIVAIIRGFIKDESFIS